MFCIENLQKQLTFSETSLTSVEISSSRDLYNPMMVGGVNCQKEAQLATAAENQIFFYDDMMQGLFSILFSFLFL